MDLIETICRQAAARRARSPPPRGPPKRIPLRVRLEEAKAAEAELERLKLERRAYRKELIRELFPDGEPKPEKPERRMTHAQMEDVYFAMVDEFEKEREERVSRGGEEGGEETLCRMDALNARFQRLWALHSDEVAESLPRYVEGFPVRESMRNRGAPRHSIPTRTERTGLDACLRCQELGMRCSRQTMRPGSGQGGSAATQRRKKRDEPCSRCVRHVHGCCAEYQGRGQVGRGEKSGRNGPKVAPQRTVLIDGVEVDANQFALPVPEPGKKTAWPEWWKKAQEERLGGG